MSGYKLTFWRPEAPSNYVILSDCVTSRSFLTLHEEIKNLLKLLLFLQPEYLRDLPTQNCVANNTTNPHLHYVYT